MNQQHRRIVSSSLGQVSTPAPQSQRTYTVPDYTEEFEELPPQEVIRSRQQMQEQKTRAPRESVQRFEVLVGISRLTDKIEINGVNFGLRSLKTKEQRHVYKAALENPVPMDQVYILKTYTLAHSLYLIDDQPVEFLGRQTFEEKLEIIEELDDLVVDELYEKYNSMLQAHKEALNKDIGETAEEVVANIKK